MRQSSPERRRSAFWACGLLLFLSWNAAVLLGVLAGSAIRDTSAFGLDATFPAVLLALAATSALTAGHGFAGWARPAGVLAAGVLAARRAPIPVVVLTAAGAAALLRLAGVS